MRTSNESMIWFFGDEIRLSIAARFRGGRRKKRSGREQLGSDLSRSPRLSTGDRSGSQFSEGLNPRRKELYSARELEEQRKQGTAEQNSRRHASGPPKDVAKVAATPKKEGSPGEKP